MATTGVLAYPAFVRVWVADTVRWFGTFTSSLALQLLLIETLDADQGAIGVVRAAQWLPSLLFGMVAGVLVDRVRRRPVLVAADTLSAVVLGLIVALAVTGSLTVPVLAVLVFGAGTASGAFMAAHQSFVPRLVPVATLPVAHARLDQSMTAAESVGPLLAGALVRFFSAPVALAVTALSHVVSAIVLLTVRVDEPPSSSRADRHLGRELREGARWVYRHRTLAPYALALHLWFVATSSVMTVYVIHAVDDLGLDALAVGSALACAGVAGLLGAGLAPRAGERWGVGRVCAAGDWLTALGLGAVLLARPDGPAPLAWLVAGQLVHGLGGGLKGPLELSYRNAVTPDRLRARMNATIRSFNWGSIAVSAPIAGWAALQWGNRPVIAAGVIGMAAAAAVLTWSPFRRATMPRDDAVPADV